jgi:hypothetical protein
VGDCGREVLAERQGVLRGRFGTAGAAEVEGHDPVAGGEESGCESGFAGVREVEQRGRPDKTVYTITPRGVGALRAWLEEVDEEPAGGRVVFALKLFFCDHASPATARAQLAAYRRYLERRLEAYEQMEPKLGTSSRSYRGHVLQHGLTRVRATLAWIDEAAAAIEAQPQESTVHLLEEEKPLEQEARRG